MDKNNKRLIVVGDRVLVHVQEGEERTKVGLYLPPTAMDSQAVQGGKIVATGPGLPMPDPGESGDEPWRTPLRETRFVPMQARARGAVANSVAGNAIRSHAGSGRRLRALFPQGRRRAHVRGRHVPGHPAER